MKSLVRMLLLVAAAILLAGCAVGPKITADYDRNANFTAYRSFGFFQPLGTDRRLRIADTQTLKAAVRQEMESRGYTYAETAPTC